MPEDVPRDEKKLPPTFDREKVEKIIEELYQGKTLTSTCKREDIQIPAGTFLLWVKNNVDGLSERYARARQVGWEVMADEIIDISDDNSRDDKVISRGDDEQVVCNSEWVQRTKVRADNRKWIISKRLPDYSDKKQDADANEALAAITRAYSKLIENLPD